MKKIICPTDFSPAAVNAIEYAVKLAQVLKTEIEILHVQILSTTNPMPPLMASQNILTVSGKLQKICTEINQTFHVICNYKIEVTYSKLEKIINEKSAKNNLIVMGTNGTDNLFQFLFGTNTFHVIRKSKCPVLMIPEKVKYKEFKKIVFAWDYSRDNSASFIQLKEFLGTYSPEIVFLHVSKEKIEIGDEIFKAVKDDLVSHLGEEENLTYKQIYLESPDTIARKIDDFMADSKSDLLAVTFFDRGILENIFHGNIVKGLSESADYPLLALHM